MIKPEGRGFNSHPGQNLSLSLSGSNFISRADAQMVYMGGKLALCNTLYHSIVIKINRSMKTP